MCSYGFSEWDASLNQLVPGQSKGLPRTDVRLRPDLRALEEGRYIEVHLLSHLCDKGNVNCRRSSVFESVQ